MIARAAKARYESVTTRSSFESMTADLPLTRSLAGNPAISIRPVLTLETGGFASPTNDRFALQSATSKTLSRKSCKLSRCADVCDRRRCEPGFLMDQTHLTALAVEMRRSNSCCYRSNKHRCCKLCL